MVAAYTAHPARFAVGLPLVEGVPDTVWINAAVKAGNLP